MSGVMLNPVSFTLLCMASTIFASCMFEITENSTKYVYDLSSLDSHIHETRFYFNKSNVIMYLKLCKPVQLSPIICSDLSSKICIVKLVKSLDVKPFIPNAGKVIVLNDIIDNNLHLKLVSDSPCPISGLNYSTTIDFKCTNNENTIKFLLYEKVQCKFHILWSTPAACPMVASEVADSCVFEHKGHVFDFRSLRQPEYYTVPYKDSIFWEINICGTVNKGHCRGEVMGCQINGSGYEKSVIGMVPSAKFLKEEDSFKFVYKTEDEHKMELALICDYDVIFTQPKSATKTKEFKKKNIKFMIETPLACAPEKLVDCWVTQSKAKYDASSLRLHENWKIKGPFNTTFLLNFCGPLVKDALWPGGEAAAGIVYNNGSIKNLGMHVKPPTVDRSGKLVLEYKGGDLCNSTKRIITKIEISCSQNATDLYFNKLEDCKYFFVMSHPAVCPTKFSVSSDCKVQEPVYARYVQLNHKDQSIVVNEKSNSRDYSFKLNLCSSKTGKCNGSQDASICFIKGNKEIIIGKRSSQKLIYENGSLYFDLVGNECREGVPSKTRIEVLCDYSASNHSEPKFQSQDENCNFYFTWTTKEACPLRSTTSCFAVDQSEHLYDLSSLTLNDRNYQTIGDDALFLLNVCGSLWFGKNEMCPSSSGACMKKGDEFYDIGQVKYPPRVSNESVILKYEEGSVCRDSAASEHYNHATIIQFICDSEELGPEFVKHDRCEYHFIWRTTKVCLKNEVKRSHVLPLNSLNFTGTRSTDEACKTYHPDYKFRFDLSRLRNRTYEVIGEDGSKYRISVCEDLGKFCPNRSGVCGITGSKTSLGSANDDLFYRGGRLYLNYTDGHSCGGGRKHFTEINFSCCASKDCPAGPSAVSKVSECQHVVTWRTRYACAMSDCAVNDTNRHRQIDLSVLRKTQSNYKINISGVPVLINVCNSLVAEKGLYCPSESSACVVASSKTNSINLGISHLKPVVVNAETVSLKYSHGSNCTKDPGYNYSSQFVFKCNHSIGVGAPIYERITSDCEYQFNWETSVVCPNTTLNFIDSNCSLVNPYTGKILDLNPAWESGPIEVKSNSKKYFVNLCSKKSQCDSGLCAEIGESWVSYGQVPKTAIFSFNYNTTTFILTDGASCDKSDKPYHSEIRLRCTENMEDPENGWSVISEENCERILEWQSAAACYTSQDRSHSNYAYKLRTILMSTISGILILLMCGILCVRYAKKNDINLNVAYNSWRSRSYSDSSDVVYTRVGATEEATVRLGGTTPDQPTETDSDEELLRLV